ncbi:MAG TPA: hypothetical protein PK323_05840, partial [Bacteroidia bacterium]|nr:hypothetical protein [Bacteroidia bacterium]
KKTSDIADKRKNEDEHKIITENENQKLKALALKEAQLKSLKETELAIAKRNLEEEARKKKELKEKLNEEQIKQKNKIENPVPNNAVTQKNRAAAETESKRTANEKLRYKALEEAERARIAREEEATLKRKQVREKMRENSEAIEAFRKKNEQELAAKQQMQIEAQRRAIEAKKGNPSGDEQQTGLKRKSFNSEGSAIDKQLATGNSLDSLLKSYPNGVTNEELITGNCKINRIIYINGGVATEYKKITYKWGVFYKKNNKDITESMFKNETKNLKN